MTEHCLALRIIFRSDFGVNINGFTASGDAGKFLQLRLTKESLKDLFTPSRNTEDRIVVSELERQGFGSP